MINDSLIISILILYHRESKNFKENITKNKKKKKIC